MRKGLYVTATALIVLVLPLTAYPKHHRHSSSSSQTISMPTQISPPGEKTIVVDPNLHGWGAYDADGTLVKSGMATAGANYCRDIHRRCHTRSGTFRIYSLGGPGCVSHKFPVGRGGAPMPYCMFFNGGQALHGSYEVVYGNISHGCVRLHVGDAEWIRYEFAERPNAENGYRGTKVVVRPY